MGNSARREKVGGGIFLDGSEMGNERERSLLAVISELFDDGSLSHSLPRGVQMIERVTSDSVRINFSDKVDPGILSKVSQDEGCIVQAPRVMDRGTVVARVGSRSDPGRRHDLFIYLIPSGEKEMSIYRKVVAAQKGVFDPTTGRINFEKFYQYNLKIIRLTEKYRKEKYAQVKHN